MMHAKHEGMSKSEMKRMMALEEKPLKRVKSKVAKRKKK